MTETGKDVDIATIKGGLLFDCQQKPAAILEDQSRQYPLDIGED